MHILQSNRNEEHPEPCTENLGNNFECTRLAVYYCMSRGREKVKIYPLFHIRNADTQISFGETPLTYLRHFRQLAKEAMGQCAVYKTKNMVELYRACNNLDTQTASHARILAFITWMLQYCQCADTRHNKNIKQAEKAFGKPKKENESGVLWA